MSHQEDCSAVIEALERVAAERGLEADDIKNIVTAMAMNFAAAGWRGKPGWLDPSRRAVPPDLVG